VQLLWERVADLEDDNASLWAALEATQADALTRVASLEAEVAALRSAGAEQIQKAADLADQQTETARRIAPLEQTITAVKQTVDGVRDSISGRDATAESGRRQGALAAHTHSGAAGHGAPLSSTPPAGAAVPAAPPAAAPTQQPRAADPRRCNIVLYGVAESAATVTDPRTAAHQALRRVDPSLSSSAILSATRIGAAPPAPAVGGEGAAAAPAAPPRPRPLKVALATAAVADAFLHLKKNFKTIGLTVDEDLNRAELRQRASLRAVVAAEHAAGRFPHWRDGAVLYIVVNRRARPWRPGADVDATTAAS